MTTEKIETPRLKLVLADIRKRKNSGLHITTLFRYASGKWPKAMRELAQHPEAIEAWLEDVKAWHEKQSDN